MRRLPWRREPTFGEAFDLIAGPWDEKTVRRLTGKQIREALSKTIYLTGPNKLLLEAEQRRREQEAGPAGKAVRISRWALGLSVAAFLMSLVQMFSGKP